MDIDPDDPNIRGAVGSVWAAAEVEERALVENYTRRGLGSYDALALVAEKIAIRSQQVIVNYDQDHPNPALAQHPRRPSTS